MLTRPTINYRHFSRYYTAIEPFLAQPKVRAYTMAILSFFTLSFFGYFAIRPTLITISNLKKQIVDASYVDKKLEEKINALSEAQIQYESIKPDLEIVQAALPQETKFSPFIKTLERIASESGTNLTSLSFPAVDLSPLEATDAAREIPIEFSLQILGDYSGITNFIKTLTNFERLAIIKKMRLSTKEEKGSLNLILTGYTYYYVPLNREYVK